MFLYSLLSLFYAIYHVRYNQFRLNQEVSQNDTISLYESNNRTFLQGFDLRPIQHEEPPLETLIDLQEKQKRMLKLCNENYSLLDREQWAREYLEENETMATNLFKAGLLNDWNFEM